LRERAEREDVEEAMLLSQDALAECWSSPEDEEEWRYLAEAGMSDYLKNLEDYEEKLARGEIHWE
jgi:hypothetical protein